MFQSNLGLGTYLLNMDTEQNIITLKFNPNKMLHGFNLPGDGDRYGETLEHIKRRIDWCIRKSAGESHDIHDYPPCQST